MNNPATDDLSGGAATNSTADTDAVAVTAPQRPPLPPSIPDYVVLSPLPLPLRPAVDVTEVDAWVEEEVRHHDDQNGATTATVSMIASPARNQRP